MKQNLEGVNVRRNGNRLRRFILPAVLVLVVTLLAVGFSSLLPKVALKGPGAHSRTGWYLHSGQWRADMRTLAAMTRYVASADDQCTASLAECDESDDVLMSSPPLPEYPPIGGRAIPAQAAAADEVKFAPGS